MKKIMILISFLVLLPALRAQISPGKLHQSHVHLEGWTQCTQCHAVGKQVSAEKCLTCHQLIRTQIDLGKGLHALPAHYSCETCHVEHHGRNFDLIYWEGGESAFNHSVTGFSLEGRHAELKCRECHQARFIQNSQKLLDAGKDLNHTYLGLESDCRICHVSPHRNQFKSRNCSNCHSFKTWKPASRFNHDSTGFALTGRHQDLHCNSCHRLRTDDESGEFLSYFVYENLKFSQCSDCHQDVHQGKLGPDCKRCHSTVGWDQGNWSGFDHDLTGFHLQGKHADLSCTQCHLPGKKLEEMRGDHCTRCHSDYHQGRFLGRSEYEDCSNCHRVQGFSPALYTTVQHQKTRFPLSGAHLAVPCDACHLKQENNGIQETRFNFPDLQCHACHRDPHQGELNEIIQKKGCEICHNTEGWHSVQFDHRSTGFLLTGRHETLECIACHTDPLPSGKMTTRFRNRSPRCESCHSDNHQGQFARQGLDGGFSTDCSRCHTTVDWLAEKFNHNRDSAFKLTGAHTGLACSRCHHQVHENGQQFMRYKPMQHACNACHGLRVMPQ